MPGSRSLKPIPKFETEDEEREFWAAHDSTELVDWSQAKPVTFSRLKPSPRELKKGCDTGDESPAPSSLNLESEGESMRRDFN